MTKNKKTQTIFNFQFTIYNQSSMTQFTKNNYDLEKRTAKFGENIIGFCKGIKQDSISLK